MRNLIFILSIIVSLYGNSQITLEYLENEISSGDTVYFNSASIPIVETMYGEGITVINNSADTQEVIVRKKHIELIDGTSTQMCWTGACYSPFIFTAPLPAKIYPGSIEYSFSGYYNTNYTAGESVVEYTFKDTITNDSVYFVAQYRVEDLSQTTISINDIEVYPNPFKEELNIVNIPNDTDFRLISLDGREVAINVNQQADLSHLRSGVYLLVINNSRIIKLRKQ